ncbi:hypothetical protein [Saccharopolyspora hattusasensis]|uniref:hypothetical protein n=1 Tax=Saccharopolyspora hattusasensis TaxID=1128679 RepID=UPI003D9835D4
MYDIMLGRDIGDQIKFLSIDTHQARHPWPPETIVSAGKGVVVQRHPKPGEPRTHTTFFMEIYPPGAAFIRSEGQTPAECEDSAWAQYQHALDCTDGTGRHDWESRGYRNGAGFCSRCNTFDPQVFTGEQLGQHCRVCQTGTTCHWETDEATGQVSFLCADHCPPLEGLASNPMTARSPDP